MYYTRSMWEVNVGDIDVGISLEVVVVVVVVWFVSCATIVI